MLWCLNLLGGAKESRTPDLLRARQALYQLSYGPKMVGLIRLELMTPALSTRCSNQLSYRPVFKHLTKEQLVVDSCQSDNFVKEVIQPQVPLRLPCYDFTPVIGHTVVTALFAVRLATSGATNSHGVTGGVYKARERIHRGILIRDY